MKTPVMNIIDLVFTQCLTLYRDMEPHEASATILREWPEQTAAMMIKFLFDHTYDSYSVTLDIIELPRQSGFRTYLCSVGPFEGKHL